MKEILDWIVAAFSTAKAFVTQYAAEIGCGVAAVLVLVLPRWFVVVVLAAAGGVVFVVKKLRG